MRAHVCVCMMSACVCCGPYSLRHFDALQLQGRLGLLCSGATAMLGLTSGTDRLGNTDRGREEGRGMESDGERWRERDGERTERGMERGGGRGMERG